MKRIISLSSIPPRFPFLKESLETLVAQNTVDEVRLYIPKIYRRFPEYDGVLPEVPEGVTVCRIDEDLGPATKILPACKDFSGEDVQILFCDDDLIYHQNWAKNLFDEQMKHPNEAVATYGRAINPNLTQTSHQTKSPQARSIRHERDIVYRFQRLLSKLFHIPTPLWRPIVKAGYVDMLFGVGGVVVRPHFFNEEAFRIPDEVFSVDDVWLSAQLAKKNISIYCPRRFPFPRASKQSEIEALFDSQFLGYERQTNNTIAAEYCQKKYGIWK